MQESHAVPVPSIPLSSRLLEALPDPVLAFDLNDVLRIANSAAQRLTNATPDLLGQSISAALPAGLRSAIQTTLTGEAAEWVTDEGKTYSVEVQTIPSGDESIGQVRMVMLHDVTRFKLLHENYALFVDRVLHDLRSPLTYMRGYTEMLTSVGDVNPRQHEFIEKIFQGITEVVSLIENGLDAGRLDPVTGFYVLKLENCLLPVIVNEVVTSNSHGAEKKHLKLIAEVAPNIPPVPLDAEMVRRALNNLVDNAIKYTPESGTITIRAYIKDGSAYLSVQDTGLGVSEEDQKTIFDKWRRVRRPEFARVKGSGLGLFNVRSVSQGHGGDAWVESFGGNGSTFVMQLPIVNATPAVLQGEASGTATTPEESHE